LKQKPAQYRYSPQAPSAVSGSSSSNSSDGTTEFGVIAVLPTQNGSQMTRWLGFKYDVCANN
jgi:hypothetical protein